MLEVEHKPNFLKKIHKIKDNYTKERVKNQIKGTRELYIGSFRLSYAYLKDENKIIFLDLYHKDEQ
jgi:mRNA-degrading endonuclease RelE of RelBE toxin-antitoxin system